MTPLQDDASALLARVGSGDGERRNRLSPEDRAIILRLGAKGHATQSEIAQVVGCDQSTVSRVLALLDTRAEARTLLESAAVRLADTVANTDDAAIALKALGKLDVVRDDRPQPGALDGSGVTVGILFKRQHGWRPMAPVITIDAVAKQTE